MMRKFFSNPENSFSFIPYVIVLAIVIGLYGAFMVGAMCSTMI